MELYQKTAAELSAMLKNKEVSSVELTKAAFARTAAVEDKVGAYITLTDEQLEEITAEHLKEFADTVVDGSGYNWFSIKSYSGNGICFTGSDISSAVYGKLDKDCSVLETLGLWVRDADGNYTYSENK